MKKFIALLLALVTALSLVACGSKDNGGSTDGDTVKIGIFEPTSGQNGAGGKKEILGIEYANSIKPTVTINGKEYKVQLITACARDGHCSLTVKDNGIGIPKEAQSSVFERFYRVDKSRSKATGGTGLGLAIVKHIARIHNARIKLESEVDVGTTITVIFETAH